MAVTIHRFAGPHVPGLNLRVKADLKQDLMPGVTGSGLPGLMPSLTGSGSRRW